MLHCKSEMCLYDWLLCSCCAQHVSNSGPSSQERGQCKSHKQIWNPHVLARGPLIAALLS